MRVRRVRRCLSVGLEERFDVVVDEDARVQLGEGAVECALVIDGFQERLGIA